MMTIRLQTRSMEMGRSVRIAVGGEPTFALVASALKIANVANAGKEPRDN